MASVKISVIKTAVFTIHNTAQRTRKLSLLAILAVK